MRNRLIELLQKVKQQNGTNYDRIRKMTVDELADFFENEIDDDFIINLECDYCKKVYNECPFERFGGCPSIDISKKKLIKKWLKSTPTKK